MEHIMRGKGILTMILKGSEDGEGKNRGGKFQDGG